MAQYNYLSDGRPDGTMLGNSSTDPVGFWGKAPTTQPSALTAGLTTITIADAAGTPDYAISAVINSSAYGFANAAELISVLYVIKNLQTRVAELEAALEGVGIVAAN